MQNQEFQKLLLLLESTDEANVRLGLQLAMHYEVEFEAHFGYNLKDYSELLEFLAKYVWASHVYYAPKSFKNIYEIEAQGQEIATLPRSIFLLSKLKNISLCNSSLTVLPVDIGELQNLFVLRLDDNQLTALPTEIGKLSYLCYLYANNNYLTTLPAEIGKLQNLSYLCVNNNYLTALPAEIGNLQNLQKLQLTNNPLTSLPESLKELKKCKIYVGENPSETLRRQVSDWENVVFSD